MRIRTVIEPPPGVDLDSAATTPWTARVLLAIGAGPVPGGEFDPTADLDLVEWMGIRLRRALGEAGKVILADDMPVAIVVVDGGRADAVARIVARRLLGVLREPYHLPRSGLARIRPSIGVSWADRGSGETIGCLLARARDALSVARDETVEPIAFA